MSYANPLEHKPQLVGCFNFQWNSDTKHKGFMFINLKTDYSQVSIQINVNNGIKVNIIR